MAWPNSASHCSETDKDDFVVREQLLAHVTHDEPPMTLTSAGLIAQGARRRTLRVAGMTGAALTAVALVGVLLYAPPSGSAPPVAALSAEAECLARVPIVPGATPDVTADPLVHMSPPADLPTPTVFDSDLKTRVTCYLVDAIPAMIPGVQFTPVNYRGDPPFAAIGDDGALRTYARTPIGGVGVMLVPIDYSSSSSRRRRSSPSSADPVSLARSVLCV